MSLHHSIYRSQTCLVMLDVNDFAPKEESGSTDKHTLQTNIILYYIKVYIVLEKTKTTWSMNYI